MWFLIVTSISMLYSIETKKQNTLFFIKFQNEFFFYSLKRVEHNCIFYWHFFFLFLITVIFDWNICPRYLKRGKGTHPHFFSQFFFAQLPTSLNPIFFFVLLLHSLQIKKKIIHRNLLYSLSSTLFKATQIQYVFVFCKN